MPSCKHIFIAWVLVLLFPISVNSQIISTVAGNGTGGYSGDGGPALNAQLSDMYYTYPAIDHAGNMYIVQHADNTIRKVDPSGIITTIAGRRGVIGYSGDGGPAINALLYHPSAIAIDGANNIFFADGNGNVIRKIDPAGIITSVSGTYTTSCGVGDGGPLSLARFRAISALAFDGAGNLYISDYGCNTVRKVNTAGIISTIAGNGTLGFSGDGAIATLAQLAYPSKVAVDNAGNVYIPDAQNHRVRKVSSTGIITTVAGNGSRGYSGDGGLAVNAEIAYPGSVVVDRAGNLYTGDGNHVIRKIDPSGVITTYAGNGTYGYSGDGGPAILASLSFTEGRINIDDNDNIYFVNYSSNVIRKVAHCLTATITQQPLNVSLCNAGNASFNITANGASSFQWQLNAGSGWVNVVDNSVYSGSNSNTLLVTAAGVAMNSFQFRCLVGNACGTIYSVPALLTVNSKAVPSITINAPVTSICEGTTLTFSATSLNAGVSPLYQWKKNGVDVGTSLATYTDNALNNGDIISCEMTSSAACLAFTTTTSNLVTISVGPKLTPSITISSSATQVCAGSPVNFVAVIQNGSVNPSYQWKINGGNVGINSATFSSSTLNSGDKVSCVLTSAASCLSMPSAHSNEVIMDVTALSTPSVNISSQNTTVCPGTPVTFSATTVNASTSTVFQWEKNGLSVGTNANTYTDLNVANSDVIRCKISTTGTCLSATGAVSNTIPVSLYPNPVIALDPTPFLCKGTIRQLDAGSFSAYSWNDGSTSRMITVTDTGTYSVDVIDNNGCKGRGTTIIDTIYSLPQKFLSSDTAICSYGSMDLKPGSPFGRYLWSTGGVTNTITISKPGIYWLEVQDSNGCQGKDSIIVSPKHCLSGFYIPTAFTPNNDGKNDMFQPLIFGKVKKYLFTVYNRWGAVVFQASKVEKGWNGKVAGQLQQTGVFVWTCRYQFEGETIYTEMGTVTLIR
jgi:gliding motility-associated-like protein